VSRCGAITMPFSSAPRARGSDGTAAREASADAGGEAPGEEGDPRLAAGLRRRLGAEDVAQDREPPQLRQDCRGPDRGVATADAFALGAEARFALAVRVDSGVPAGTVITDAATVTSATSDPNPGDAGRRRVAAPAVASVAKELPRFAARAVRRWARLAAARAIPCARRSGMRMALA
jgi:hypothetical protein